MSTNISPGRRMGDAAKFAALGILFIVSGAVALWSAEPLPPAASRKVDYQKDIQPLLENRCYECHGPKKQKSGLRLDRKTSVFQGGDSGKPALLSGKSAESLLVQKLVSTDPDEVMPPKGDKLTAEQIGLLRAWIDQGAVWPGGDETQKPHWAYVKPVRPVLPKTKNISWPRNPIDNFILNRLEKEKLVPSPEADTAILLRRVSLDLTGLPPTLAEVDAFLADKSKDAYEKAVDRLLASPAYGERWARPWLDLARYADTQGYEKDNRRTIWPYRDWVIRAFNANMPFDQFTIEQIAGDLLPNATQDQKTATGFHRNTMTNTEGGTDDEEFRYEAMVDRVNTTFSVWMGTTMACAQCHNHKYDPISTREYYQVMAFLNNTEDSDKDDERPTMKVLAAGQREQLEKLRATQSEAEKKMNDFVTTPEFVKTQADWEKRGASAPKWEPLEVAEMKSDAGSTLTKTAGGTILASGTTPAQDTYTVTVKTKQSGITAFRLEVLTDDSLPKKGPGRSADGNAILTGFKITANGQPITLKNPFTDFQQDGWPVAAALDNNSETGWAWAPQFGKPHQATFSTGAPVGDGNETTLIFHLEQQNKQWGQHVLGKFRLVATTNADPAASLSVPAEIATILAVLPDKRDDKQKTKLRDHFRTMSTEMKPLATAATAAKKAVDDFDKAIPITSVMVELPKPRETHRHIRGAFLQKGELVTAGTPATLQPFPKNAPTNRLGFARWLVNTNNPLTARVIMNRFWEQYFGKGIVETVEEFGKQGEPPSNPELLDWLATEFMRQNWDMKAMHKLVVTSAAYRQTAKVSPSLLQRDPDNRLLARGPRVRLEAEMIRDQALAVSGLLSHKIGGPSVMPPQPDGLWQVVYSGDKWETSKGEDKYRRGLYTFWRRTSPHPMMVSFDAPSREFCVLRRNRSDTPLQALNTLNDPAFIEAAQALARRVTAHGGDVKERVTFAFRTCLARTPTAQEIVRLTALYESELANYKLDAKAAEKMATSELGKPKDAVSLEELAAWTVVANVLLNLDELITKG